MTMTNERMRAALREIQNRAADALADQPSDDEVCGRHLNKALAGIELKAHTARWGIGGEARQKPVGNPVAMREALTQMLDWMVQHTGCYFIQVIPRRDNPDEVQKERDEVISRARAALSKPPRNCDRFGGDIDKLREACLRERGLNPEEDFPDVFPDWLLATARKAV